MCRQCTCPPEVMSLSPYKDKNPNFNSFVCSAPTPWASYPWGSRRGCTIWCKSFMSTLDGFSDCCDFYGTESADPNFPKGEPSDDPKICQLHSYGQLHCFPAGAVARLSDGEPKLVEDLRPGDQVQVGEAPNLCWMCCGTRNKRAHLICKQLF